MANRLSSYAQADLLIQELKLHQDRYPEIKIAIEMAEILLVVLASEMGE